MNRIFLTAIMLSASFCVAPVNAQEHHDHVHKEKHESHEHEDARGSNDEHDHHLEHDAEAHSGDAHDNHGHEEEGHGDEHGHHEEGVTEITPTRAEAAGVVSDTAGPATIAQNITLTGRITFNSDNKANVRARFPGIVREVKVNLGDRVTRGQTLAVVESNESLRNFTVTAPISGVILERGTNMGDVIHDEPMFVIADMSEVWAKFHIFPKDADAVKTGQTVNVHTLEGKKNVRATIEMLLPAADALSQTLIAIAPVPNAGGIWRPGTVVQGDVAISEKRVPVAVRSSALQTMEGETAVFLRNGSEYAKTAVRTGATDGEYTEITSGLHAGQSYVSEGSFIIKADILKAGAKHEH